MDQSRKTAFLSWEINDGPITYTIQDNEMVIGRKPTCDLVLDHINLSREHALLTWTEEGFRIKDLDSSYGTRLNGKNMNPFQWYTLIHGDRLMLGKLEMTYSEEEPTLQPDEMTQLELDYTNPALIDEMEQFSDKVGTHIHKLVKSSKNAAILRQRIGMEVETLNGYVESRFKEYAVLQEITQIIVGILDVRELLATVLKLASKVLRAERGFILLNDEERGGLRSMVTRHFDRDGSGVHEHDVNFSRTIAASCFEKGEIILIEDALDDGRFGGSDSIVSSSIRSVVCIPLRKRNRMSGVIYLDNLTTPGCFQEAQLSFLKAFASQTALALDNARLYTQAVTDGLTGLFNRKYVEERICEEMIRCRRYGRDCAVILLDIDFFKKVNDTHGHQAGDLVLQRFARALCDSARSSDIVARYGGEEFLMLLTETNLEGARIFADRLRQGVEGLNIEVDDLVLRITTSCGVSAYHKELGSEVADFINEADKALYRAKEAGRNRVC